MSFLNLFKVSNMVSPRGKEVPNQFIIDTDFGQYFQSYKSLIAYIPNAQQRANGCKITLDQNYWDYSTTTGKYRNQFLGEDKAATERKIKSGEYVLDDMNTIRDTVQKNMHSPHYTCDDGHVHDGINKDGDYCPDSLPL